MGPPKQVGPPSGTSMSFPPPSRYRESGGGEGWGVGGVESSRVVWLVPTQFNGERDQFAAGRTICRGGRGSPGLGMVRGAMGSAERWREGCEGQSRCVRQSRGEEEVVVRGLGKP